MQSGVSAGNELRRYLGCSMGNAAARVAHTFGTIGPALSTETGCSSTICSIGAAMAALRNNKTGLALVGGANLILKPFIYKDFQVCILTFTNKISHFVIINYIRFPRACYHRPAVARCSNPMRTDLYVLRV